MAGDDADRGYWLEDGYALERVLTGLTFPTNVAFDPDGELYLVEAGYSYPVSFSTPRVSRVRGGEREALTTDLSPPVIGLHWHDDGFLVTHLGNLSHVGLDGERADLVTGLPDYGDHHTNHVVVREGKAYFGQGTATNAGVVGPDNLLLGWPVTHPEGHDTPPFDVTLTGLNFRSRHPLNPLRTVETGAFQPAGTPTEPGQVVEGKKKANGVVYEYDLESGELEVFAWGFRNPYALAEDPSGRLLVVDQGGDRRGNRPLASPDALYEVREGAWYGWPDYLAGVPAPEIAEGVDMDNPKGFLLQDHPPLERPLHKWEAHSAPTFLEFPPSGAFGHAGEAFVAQFGSGAPTTTGGRPLRAGFKVTTLDVGGREERDFYRSETLGVTGGGPQRPVAARFSPDGEALYVVDFGVLGVPRTGALWRIARE